MSLSIGARIKHELQMIAVVTLYFASWLSILMLIKVLLLAQYEIAFDRWSAALIGALVLAKVVLVLDRVRLGAWIESRGAWVGVLARTVLYTLGVAVVLVIEHGVSERHEYGGFLPAVDAGIRGADAPRVAVNVICVSGALLVYNAFAVLRRTLGVATLHSAFARPLPAAPAKGSGG